MSIKTSAHVPYDHKSYMSKSYCMLLASPVLSLVIVVRKDVPEPGDLFGSRSFMLTFDYVSQRMLL